MGRIEKSEKTGGAESGPRLLLASAVAERLGVSEPTLARWRRQGRGPKFVKLSRGRSGLVRYRHEDVDSFITDSPRSTTWDFSDTTADE